MLLHVLCPHPVGFSASPPFIHHHPHPRLALAGFHEAPQVLVFPVHLKFKVKLLEDDGGDCHVTITSMQWVCIDFFTCTRDTVRRVWGTHCEIVCLYVDHSSGLGCRELVSFLSRSKLVPCSCSRGSGRSAIHFTGHVPTLWNPTQNTSQLAQNELGIGAHQRLPPHLPFQETSPRASLGCGIHGDIPRYSSECTCLLLVP